MKTLNSIIIASILFFMASCSDETPVPSNNKPVIEEEKEPSNIEKLAQNWVLVETYKDGVQLTSNGTSEYLFSEDGVFFFNNKGSYQVLGNYEFANADSTKIDMTFMGFSEAISMDLKKLTLSELELEFFTNGALHNYHYTR